MSTWIPIKTHSGEFLPRGTIFKFSAGHPFERSVVMMLCETNGSLGLIAITGYKAGIRPTVVFPQEAFPEGPGSGIDPQWLVANWNTRVWEDADLDAVFVREPLTADDL